MWNLEPRTSFVSRALKRYRYPVVSLKNSLRQSECSVTEIRTWTSGLPDFRALVADLRTCEVMDLRTSGLAALLKYGLLELPVNGGSSSSYAVSAKMPDYSHDAARENPDFVSLDRSFLMKASVKDQESNTENWHDESVGRISHNQSTAHNEGSRV